MKTKQEIIKKLEPKNINFKVDKFEDLILQDATRFDEDTRIKLNRNLTTTFNQWLKEKLKAKEMIKINIKGETRSGKSLIGLKILYEITKFYNYKFDTYKQVCSNQKEYRQKVSRANFGESFLIDENAFSNVGLGSITEIQQLKDILNITAKQNLHSIFITPRTFLDTGATMGLSYFGKDINNWLSRFLLYNLKNGIPQLMGFVIFDIGRLFQNEGCLLYKYIGGCNNPKRLTTQEILNLENGAIVKYSDCIKKDFKEDKLYDWTKQCPFYNICNSQLCKYEHKKDKWIKKELEGGMDEREKERYETAIKVFVKLAYYNEQQEIRLKAKNGKELKVKIKMLLPKISSSKYTGLEIDEILTMVTSFNDLEFLQDTCNNIELDYNEILKQI